MALPKASSVGISAERPRINHRTPCAHAKAQRIHARIDRIFDAFIPLDCLIPSVCVFSSSPVPAVIGGHARPATVASASRFLRHRAVASTACCSRYFAGSGTADRSRRSSAEGLDQVMLRGRIGEFLTDLFNQVAVKISPKPASLDVRIHACERRLHELRGRVRHFRVLPA
jgi:hypothetical protein